ncbi:MAG: nitroreductase family protein [Verrucomicrobia bacterium]|nr:nitroreductase family protein [Verrucomicrobiota bacterium]
MTHPFAKEVSNLRHPDYPIDPIILNRWSPRSMTGEEMTDEELFPLFEAARWAPSSYNNQPWRFFYAKRGTPEWALFYDPQIEFNKGWTKNAAALVVAVSYKKFDHNQKPCRTHAFDTGAAWMALALEGTRRGYVVHGMEGFNYDQVKKNLELSEDYEVHAMIAIGKRAPKENLPQELQARELPSERKKIEAIAIQKKSSKP